MAKELEGLIAKARRCKRPADQVSCAFGLADLSTRRESSEHNFFFTEQHLKKKIQTPTATMHEKLVRKGGVSSILTLLKDTQDAQCMRLSCLALANVASHAITRLAM